MFKNTLKFFSEFFDTVFNTEGNVMTPEQESYEMMVEMRKNLVTTTRENIQARIESVCRDADYLLVYDLGFENASSHLFEDSWQEKVVMLLEDDGYTCIMTFTYVNGRASPFLTVKW